MSSASRRPERVVAVGAVAAATTHLLAAVLAPTPGWWPVVLVLLALACAPCAGHLWRVGGNAALAVTAVTGALTLILHLFAPAAGADGTVLMAGGHHGTATVAVPLFGEGHFVMVGAIAAELVVLAACVVLLCMRRPFQDCPVSMLPPRT